MPLFRDLAADELADVKALFVTQTFVKLQNIVSEGEPGGALYIVLEGVVAVLRESVNANETIVTTLESGDYFGEMSLLDPKQPRAATVRALGDVRVAVLRHEGLIDLQRSHPVLAGRLLQNLSSRIRQAHQIAKTRTDQEAASRLALILVTMVGRRDDPAKNAAGSRLRLTSAELAAMTGQPRELVKRTLKQFSAAGLIQVYPKEIGVLNCERLGSFVGNQTAGEISLSA